MTKHDDATVIRISLDAIEREMPDRRLQLGGAATVSIGSVTYFLETDWLSEATSLEVCFVAFLLVSFGLAVAFAFFSSNRLAEIRFLYANILAKLEIGEDWTEENERAISAQKYARFGYISFFVFFGFGVFSSVFLAISRLL